jgi:hypothetical protein
MVGSATEGRQVLLSQKLHRFALRDQYRKTIGPYQGCPAGIARLCADSLVGAVLIGPFEGSRWGGGRGGAMGFGWVRTSSAAAWRS